MKKLFCVLLSAVLTLSISACSKDDKTRLYAGACTYYADGGLMSFSEYLYKYDENGNQVTVLNQCRHTPEYMQQEGIEGIIQGEWNLLQEAAAAAAAAAGEGAPAPEQPAQDTVVNDVPENVAAGN